MGERAATDRSFRRDGAIDRGIRGGRKKRGKQRKNQKKVDRTEKGWYITKADP